MSLAGTWHIRQDWNEGNGLQMTNQGDTDGYTIKVEFELNGRVKAYGPIFWGTWTESDAGVNFAMTDIAGQTLTLYQGAPDGSGFKGNMQGLSHFFGKVHQGSWTATPAQ